MNPRNRAINLSLSPRDYYIFFSICHGSDINCEDGKNSFVAVEVNSEKSDYG